MNYKKKLSVLMLVLILLLLVVGYFVKLYSLRIGRAVSTPKPLVKKILPEAGSVAPISPFVKEWDKLDSEVKGKYKKLANHLRMFGICPSNPFLNKSNQDHTLNQYYKYAHVRLNRISRKKRLTSKWLEAYFKEIPLWKQNLFAYEHTKLIDYAYDCILLVEKEFSRDDLKLNEFSLILSFVQNLPLEFLTSLPYWLHRYDTMFNKQNSTHQKDILKLSELLKAVALMQKSQVNKKRWHSLTVRISKISWTLDYHDRFAVLENLISSFYYAKSNSYELDEDLLNKVEYMATEMMYLLEPDGCLPQFEKQYKRINCRESMYFAAEIFDREDFRFVAFGGYKNPDIQIPNKTSIKLIEANIIVLRNTWNILWTQPKVIHRRKYQKILGPNTSQLSFNIDTNEISYYAQNKPQFKVNVKGVSMKEHTVKYNQKMEFYDDNYECDIFEIKNGFTLVFIRKYGFWFLKNVSQVVKFELLNFRSDITVEENKILSNHDERKSVFYTYGESAKHKGEFLIEGFRSFDRNMKLNSKYEGYYPAGVIKGLKNLKVVCNPRIMFTSANPDYIKKLSTIEVNYFDNKLGELLIRSEHVKPKSTKIILGINERKK